MSTEIRITPSADQSKAWSAAAGDDSLEAWLAALADKATSPAPARTWPATVTLKYPLDVAGERIAALTFRRGRIGDIKGMKLTAEVATNDLMMIASRLSGQTLKVIEMLDVDDAGEVTDIALDFYVKFLTAGKQR